jgi:hypothetical protein
LTYWCSSKNHQKAGITDNIHFISPTQQQSNFLVICLSVHSHDNNDNK